MLQLGSIRSIMLVLKRRSIRENISCYVGTKRHFNTRMTLKPLVNLSLLSAVGFRECPLLVSLHSAFNPESTLINEMPVPRSAVASYFPTLGRCDEAKGH